MSVKIENTPSPSVLMNSMRSIGYTFKTALADIIDNSISAEAKNVYINVPINDSDLFISVLDDGHGMTRNELFNAMKYGSDREYSLSDLGRFGLGLKSASLSQCRILTVLSKNENVISGFQWDLDLVLKDKKWDCIELNAMEIAEIPNADALMKLPMGTLVVWQNFDIAYKKSNGRIREYLSDEMADAEKHLRLVFHRFLSNRFKPLKIYVNNDLLEPLDPFLEDHPKTDSKKVSEITFDGETIKVQPFILPHMADLSDKDIDKLGGIDALRNDQGFYIYRNDRLIIYGKWFRLSSANVSAELLKYGRIKVDIPNSLDEIWDIDIKKQNATIPRQILNYLKKAVSDVCFRSKEKTTKRVRLTLERDDNKIWNKSLDKNQKERFFINKESEFIRHFLDEFDDNCKRKILNFIDTISATLPLDDIYNAVCNKNNATNIEEEQFEAIVLEGVSQFRMIKNIIQKSDEEVMSLLTRYEPFNDEIIADKIRRIVINENA